MKKKIVYLLLALALAISTLCVASYAASYDDEPEVYDLHWNNRTAKWSVDGKAHKYEVRLYRDGRRVFTKTQTGRSRNFSSEMTRGSHEYYFEVRPYNNYSGWGSWETSDSVYITTIPDPTPYYPTEPAPVIINGGPGENINIPTPQIVPSANAVGSWTQANGKWYYVYTNGVFATNSWIQLNNKWYYVDITGAMVTGLQNIGSHTFYFNPDGTMATGTIILNGITHFFDANGIMVY